MLFSMLVVCMLALMSALSMSPARAQSDEPAPIIWLMEMDVVWTPSPHWIGTLTTLEGDVLGSIMVMENPATFPGKTEHFNEDCTITTTDGAVITGYDLGVYNLKTFKYRANGWITDVSSPAWEHLIGYKLHYSGTTTPFVMGGDVHASGTMMLVAP